jgi:hypothetical protein
MSYIGQELRQGKAVRTLFTASGGETAVTVAYTPGQLSVFLNGVKLIEAVDYVATTGTSITGLSPALTVDDTIDCVAIDALTSNDTVPTQAGNSGKFLTTNATTTSWASVDALPTQSGQSGKFLTTNATTASWATVDALPTQSGQSGKYLTTDATTASWATPSIGDASNLATLGGDFTAPVNYSTALVGPVTIPNVTVNGNLNVMTSLNVTGNVSIATTGSLNIIG